MAVIAGFQAGGAELAEEDVGKVETSEKDAGTKGCTVCAQVLYEV